MRDFSYRNPGLDLVRNLAIFLVIVQHIAFLGGLANDGMGMAHKLQARFLEALSQSCVDLFGLLSGYLCVAASGWKWRKLGKLYLQVWTTGLFVLGGCALVGLAFPSAFHGCLPVREDWLTAAFPLLRDEYWYFTGYLFVFLLAPILNQLLFSEGRERTGLAVAALLFCVVCGMTALPGGVTRLPLADGYSAAWLVCLYVFGAVLRRFENRLSSVRTAAFFVLAAAGVAATVAQRIAMAAVPALKSFFSDVWTLSSYTSPTVTLTSMSLLLGCARLKTSSFGGRFLRLNAALASCAFGIYLFHVQPFFFRNVFKGHFAFIDRAPDGLFALVVLGTACALYLLFAGIEVARRYLVSRVGVFFGQIRGKR